MSNRMDRAAFVACRQPNIGCSEVGGTPPRIPTQFALQYSEVISSSLSWTKLYSLSNDDDTVHNKKLNQRNIEVKSSIKKPSAASTFISALFAISLLFGTIPNHLPLTGQFSLDSTALALELQSTSTWPPPPTTSSISDVPTHKKRYWDSMRGTTEDIAFANEKLIDHTVATISTMYYDSSGGFNFDSQEFYKSWKTFRYSKRHPHENVASSSKQKVDDRFDALVDSNDGFATREAAVKTLKSVVSSLNDPYSKYLTREELRQELEGGGGNDGFLGLGALVDLSPPSSSASLAFGTTQPQPSDAIPSEKKDFYKALSRPLQGGGALLNQQFTVPLSISVSGSHGGSKRSATPILSETGAENLPVVIAIIPNSPAERAGLVVGDRIAAVGDYQFTGLKRAQVQKAMADHFHGTDYFGRGDITIAKQVVADSLPELDTDDKYVFENGWYHPKSKRKGISDNIVLGYKMSHLKSIPTTLTAQVETTNEQSKLSSVIGGDSIVHYELLSNDSIFQHSKPVGYIRLTRFSKSQTAGYINAIKALEEAGAQSYILDLRNNYGGVIQYAMLTASSLLRDPYDVLCYTLNSRGGMKPQENMEYVSDPAYNGYLLSSEPSTVSRDIIRREHPEYLEDGGWTAPTSYASLKELRMTRGIKPAHAVSVEELERPAKYVDRRDPDINQLSDIMAKSSQKKVVLLINEGTASAAEVFASSLHDNGRAFLVGSKTFGKGLIQHNFPLPDGGGLRLTVAEYLTPSLQHVTKVGEAKFDSGIKPDVRCESKQGIPQNINADLCVGVALDVLESQGG